MSGNKGLDAHNHGLSAWEMLHHEHWDLPMLEKLRDRLKAAVENLTEHLAERECPCGDARRDIEHYRELLKDVEWGIRNRNLSPSRSSGIPPGIHEQKTSAAPLHPASAADASSMGNGSDPAGKQYAYRVKTTATKTNIAIPAFTRRSAFSTDITTIFSTVCLAPQAEATPVACLQRCDYFVHLPEE